MRIIRYTTPGSNGLAVGIAESDGSVAEVPSSGGDLGPLLLLDGAGLERVASSAIAHHKLDDVKLLAPVGRPGKILCLAANYHPTDQLNDVNMDIATPRFFIKPSSAMVGPDDDITYNPVATSLIQEIELGVVIGKPGKNIAPEDAYDHIFGYTIINDVSARGLDFSPEREGVAFFDWLNGKWLDTHCPVGPWIVDREALPDVTSLGLKTVVNGDVHIDSNTSRMIFDIPRQIGYISKLCTLEPGDLIATGVALGPAGADEKMLEVGDVIEGTVEGVGTLRNTVAAPGA